MIVVNFFLVSERLIMQCFTAKHLFEHRFDEKLIKITATPSSLNVVLYKSRLTGWGLLQRRTNDWTAAMSANLFKMGFSIQRSFKQFCFLVCTVLSLVCDDSLNSRTCLLKSPKGNRKSGHCRQVTFLDRFYNRH